MPSDLYEKLERRLLLLAWAIQQFGFSKNAEMLADLKQAAEGFDATGMSHVARRLLSTGRLRIIDADLLRYDTNVRAHLTRINALRKEPITLRYFQHLALLFTERYLDCFFNARGELLRQLNKLVAERNSRRFGEPEHPEFSEADLSKLAFWMATGSGKTLLLHINLLQFLHYNRNPLDNVLLITPNEDLSEQHLAELEASGISAAPFSLEQSGLEATRPSEQVRVIEVTKLVEEKKGGGVRVPVKAFLGNNLIFVDEGHKGTHGDVYRGYRDALAETGFTFEYSATFGQALDAVEKQELTNEYAKAILFDYSYKYFYGDGFGKDFQVINIENDEDENLTQTLMLANLLAFYEQTLLYGANQLALKPYNIARPLWLFVGHTVTGREGNADLIKVVRFLARVVSNHAGWTVNTIEALLKGETSLAAQGGKPFFHDQLAHLRNLWKSRRNFRQLFEDMLKRVFRAGQAAQLELCPLRGQEGEIGLRVHGSDTYFGLIYIGSTSEFRKLAERESDVVVTEDAMAASLFADVREDKSSVNVLIGARMFIEGWSSWRVSSMCLLNIARAEGSQVIQLFGRGVRLLGLNHSLKRSTYVVGVDHPQWLPSLERLFVFGVRANYMRSFKEDLLREGVDSEGYMEFTLPLWKNAKFLKEHLVIPHVPSEISFQKDESAELVPVDLHRLVHVDLSVQLSSLRSGETIEAERARTRAKTGQLYTALTMLQWDELYLALLDYVRQKNYQNLVIASDAPRKILSHASPAPVYELTAPSEVFQPTNLDDWRRLHIAALSLLQKYTDAFYRNRQKRYETLHMRADRLREEHANMREPYRVQVPRSNQRLIEAVKELCDSSPKAIWRDLEDLKNIYFDQHLYQPLLVNRGNEELSIKPNPLEDSEQAFVDKLREYWKSLSPGDRSARKLYLLRNLTRGSGVGFYEAEGFFPDFILWIIEERAQRVIFIEPHGMQYETAVSPRPRLFEDLQSYTKSIVEADRSRDLSFDAWIVSKTPFVSLRLNFSDDGRTPWTLDQFHDVHIVFAEEKAYIDVILGRRAGRVLEKKKRRITRVLQFFVTCLKKFMKKRREVLGNHR
jgi:hypothetical protein